MVGRIDVDVLGAQDLLQRLKVIRANASDARDALNAVADDFLDVERARFRGAAHWQPLTAQSAAQKVLHGRSARPLAGGALEKSMTVARSKYSVRRVRKDGVLVGTRDPVARLHQNGTKKRKRGGALPARPIVDVRPSDQTRWRDIIARSLDL